MLIRMLVIKIKLHNYVNTYFVSNEISASIFWIFTIFLFQAPTQAKTKKIFYNLRHTLK